ncbi:MAG: glutathione peroxidase [Flavobacteriales bacterium]|nr:glutathione peroxidase [Flavobacteriales bacterium]
MIFSALFGCKGNAQQVQEPVTAPVPFHELVATDIHGEPFAFSQLKGKKVLVVNTASKCGYTPQYSELQTLYEQYAQAGVEIIGFPSNDFLRQEPGSEAEIEAFCKKNYGVEFPMMSKIEVKGEGMHPVYRWLTSKEQNGALDSKVKWNFQKYLIDEEGRLLGVFPPGTKPLDTAITDLLSKS